MPATGSLTSACWKPWRRRAGRTVIPDYLTRRDCRRWRKPFDLHLDMNATTKSAMSIVHTQYPKVRLGQRQARATLQYPKIANPIANATAVVLYGKSLITFRRL